MSPCTGGELRLTSLLTAARAAAAVLGGRTKHRPPLPPLPPAGTYALAAGVPPVADRARRAGHPDDVVADLERALAVLGPRVAREVLDPLRRGSAPSTVPPVAPVPLLLGGHRARQVDGTTCGSAVLALLAAAGDPVLALWLATGPPGRLARLQRVLKAQTARRAVGPLPWPSALGTPPWTAANVARHADVRYTHRVVGPRADPVLGAALDAAARGVPVPLYTGGDLRGGVAAAVPRHVVLLTEADAPGSGPRWCRLYEPSSGTLHRVPAAALAAGRRAPGTAVAALGGWPHVCWALLPASAGPPAGGRGGAASGWTSPARATFGEETR